jgi:NAD(P) transhydrogenase subunit alpha
MEMIPRITRAQKVEAFDTRPVVEEQVKSLGARFVKIDLGETGQTKD